MHFVEVCFTDIIFSSNHARFLNLSRRSRTPNGENVEAFNLRETSRAPSLICETLLFVVASFPFSEMKNEIVLQIISQRQPTKSRRLIPQLTFAKYFSN